MPPKQRCILKRVHYTCVCVVYEVVRQCGKHQQYGGRCLILKDGYGNPCPNEVEYQARICPKCEEKIEKRREKIDDAEGQAIVNDD